MWFENQSNWDFIWTSMVNWDASKIHIIIYHDNANLRFGTKKCVNEIKSRICDKITCVMPFSSSPWLPTFSEETSKLLAKKWGLANSDFSFIITTQWAENYEFEYGTSLPMMLMIKSALPKNIYMLLMYYKSCRCRIPATKPRKTWTSNRKVLCRFCIESKNKLFFGQFSL